MRSSVIPDYDLDRPTAPQLRASLEGILGPRDASTALRLAMREIEARGDLHELPEDQLLALALALAGQRGLPSVIGRSFAIRLSTYLDLSHTQQVPS